MSALRFEVGQQVWVADFSPLDPSYETCPDCGGTGRLRVIFHDETQVSIACQNCALGYDPPTGRIMVRRVAPNARQAIICGYESHDKIRWHVDSVANCYRIFDDEKVFVTQAEAQARAESDAAEYEANERKRLFEKEQDTRSWAWNASYHRKQIKEAQRQIEYHTAKLSVAALTALEGLEGYACHSRFAVVPLREHLEGAADRLAGLCQQLEAHGDNPHAGHR